MTQMPVTIVQGYWTNGHYRRWKYFGGYGWAKVSFYGTIVDDIEERPTFWQRIVMALQGWHWHDGPSPKLEGMETKPDGLATVNRLPFAG